jgi:CO dehydrogenase maturation factor
MEAGIEHLGRSTSQAIDKMFIVVEPGSRSVFTAKTILRLARDIGVETFGIIANKIQDAWQKKWIHDQFPDIQVIGMIPYSKIVLESDLREQPLIDRMDESLKNEFAKIYSACRGTVMP